MPQPNANSARLQFLADTLRNRFPGFTKREQPSINPPAHLDETRKGGLTRFENTIKSIFARSYPEHPAYNTLRRDALHTFRKEDFATKSVARNERELQQNLLTLHGKRPTFAKPAGEDLVLRLHTALEAYSSIRGGNLNVFPSIETLGHRSDETGLLRRDPGEALERTLRKPTAAEAADQREQPLDTPESNNQEAVWVNIPASRLRDAEQRKQQLKEINSCLDELCPEGSYFNELRQEVIHQVWSNKAKIKTYKEKQALSAGKDWRRFDGRLWVPKDLQRDFDAISEEINRHLRAENEHLRARAPRGVQPIAPENAVKIDQIVRNYDRNLRAKPIDRTDPATGTPQVQVPELLLQNINYIQKRAHTNDIARQWAAKCAQTVEEIIPFENRQTLDKRLKLQNDVFRSRGQLLNDTRSQNAHDISFQTTYWTQMKKKPELMRRLAGELDNFDKAWTGALRSAPEGQTARPEAEPSRSLLGKRRREDELSHNESTRAGPSNIPSNVVTGEDASRFKRSRIDDRERERERGQTPTR